MQVAHKSIALSCEDWNMTNLLGLVQLVWIVSEWNFLSEAFHTSKTIFHSIILVADYNFFEER